MKSLFYGVLLGLCAMALLGWLLISRLSEPYPAPPNPPLPELARVPVERPAARTLSATLSDPLITEPAAFVVRPRPGMVRREVSSPVAGVESAAPDRQRDAIPGEHVLAFYSARERDAFLEAAKLHGIEVLGRIDGRNAIRVRSPSDQALADALAGSPMPVAMGMNHRVYSPPVPAPPEAAAGMVGFGPHALRWLGLDVDNSDWGRGVKVAVLDTPMDSHPAIPEGQVGRLSGGTKSGPAGQVIHGTAVASLIVGRTADGALGVAPAATIMSVPVLNREGDGNAFDAARGIMDAVAGGAQVISMSLGGMGDDFMLRDAVAYALEKGVVVVAAAGNDGTGEIYYPARYPGVIAVSAVDASGRHMYFANSGPEVDIVAPGLWVYAAGANGGLSPFSGTSASVPFVSGAVAWLLGQRPELTPGDVASLLARCTDDVGAPGWDAQTGNGVLDIGRLVERDKPGVFDVAAGEPLVQLVGDSLKAFVSAQNRGTEVVRRLRLAVRLDGVDMGYVFSDVAVGQSVSQAVPVGAGKLRSGGFVSIECEAAIDGHADVRPSNNRVAIEVRLP
jgi:thermitase